MSQTTWSNKPGIALAGLLADASDHDIDSYINEESSGIPFGVGVIQGTNDNDGQLPTAATDFLKFLGVVARTTAVNNMAESDDIGVPADTQMNVCKKGPIYVQVEEAVDAGDYAYCRMVAGASEQLGAFGKSSDGGDCIKLKSRFKTSASEGGYAILDVDKEDAIKGYFSYEDAHAQATADTTQKLVKTDPDRHLVVTGVHYLNPTGLAAHATNFFTIQLKAGSTVVAQWSTETGEEGTIAANTFVDLVLQAAANLIVPPDTELSLVLDEDGEATLPAGRIAVHGYYL